MIKYWENTTNTDNIDRGLYIILPLRYQGSFQDIFIAEHDKEISQLSFDSADFTELLSVKCRRGNFVKRFSINGKIKEISDNWYSKVEASEIYQINDVQLFVFNNGIAFLTIYLAYKIRMLVRYINL